MCLAQGPQRNDAGEARTRGPSVSSQALNHWATVLPTYVSTNASLYNKHVPELRRKIDKYDTNKRAKWP